MSDVGDMGRLLRDRPAGLIVPPADSTALSQAMAEMNTLGAEHFRPEVEQVARQFDISATADQWLSEIRPNDSDL